jgi:hypothetical protein
VQTVEVATAFAARIAIDGQNQRVVWHRPLVSQATISAFGVARVKTVSGFKAVTRWQPRSSDSMGKGCTHMLREAGLVQLIQCVILYDKSPKLIIRCHTACQRDRGSRPSLAPREGPRRKYQYYRRCVGIRQRLTSLAGPDHAS